MDVVKIKEWLEDVPSIELVSIVESIFTLDCMRNAVVRESILQYEENEQESVVSEYSDDEVFSKYMEYRELLGDPLNLTEYLADKRDREYEPQGGVEGTNYWDEYDRELTRHASELLKEYENRNEIYGTTN